MSKLRVWLDSGANAQSRLTQEFEWSDLGLTEADWDDLSDEDQEKFARELAFAYSDWGYEKEK